MPASKLRFLVVEDHEFQRRALVQLLKTLGADAVYTAEDGRAALQVVRDPDRPIDIVVTDIAMPGMDGMEFIRHLSETGARVGVILTSALETPLLAAIANMAQAYKVRLLGAVGKPAAALKLTPLLQMYRAQQEHGVNVDGAFALDEIAEAWTHNEFECWFEPRVELHTGAVRALEATPRWRHADRGVLAPEQFMPSVAARGLRDDFVWLMLQKSVAHCRQWRASGLDVSVAVPLEFDAFTDVQMAVRVRQLAENEGLDPRYLVLGVAEQGVQADQARTLENLARLRVDGFGLAIADFGNGAMAVEELAKVAFTELKIRSKFVAGVHQDQAARAGLAVALDLAAQLKLRTVAEGVALKEEWQLLHEWGCHLGQGPFISLAMPAEAVPGWCVRWLAATIR